MLAVCLSATKGSESDKAEQLVGSVSLFGATKASDRNGPHASNGLTTAIEITDAVRESGAAMLTASRLNVHLVPQTAISPEQKISIYRTKG